MKKLKQFIPTTTDEYIGNDDPNNPLFYLDEWERDSNLCLLFEGRPGLGKTTAAYILAEHLGLDVMELNASDDRGIDVVRDKIKMTAMSSSPWGNTLILLDEADGLTKQAQDSLKRIMEKSDCWWILTCNDHAKIIPAIKSRCVQFTFKPYSVKQSRAYQQLLLLKKGVESKESAEVLHSHFAGDLRAIGNHILSGSTLSQDQTEWDTLALDIAAGDWQSTHQTMLEMLNNGATLHLVMHRIHEFAKSVGMSSQQLYPFFVVWGDFVLRMHAWPLSSESFVDYFVAALHREDTNKKEE